MNQKLYVVAISQEHAEELALDSPWRLHRNKAEAAGELKRVMRRPIDRRDEKVNVYAVSR